ncbi:MAG: winged helix-turn-helix transcriptional regulator [Candidatus Nitrosopelagicus sp.]|mgnify:FL=1|jgi:ArsR family transcriptional regulator|uniref:Transcriptional regulator ArsR family (ArsR) n=1 Tax=uncultured marine thaumarchaeote KM3_18_D11 TaxID=1456075 RepID=A0A075GSQ4_9ARCH|nr:transcriptional regulator ArsR family (arsR) [uncultured marine thaumarchaeote KM3_18_D11]MBC8250865.1 winged helix-turn-helix transcriptional regulator [Candidatus Nitrosopelagicus sp.]MBT3591766.1 winged helix-turn-helix transcriptional regulator [Candidatus Nitrosopelagicus sp.]MBT4454460.1 winged helix-turn-helix transcriptional regulator [Candidatus Nitrosopelagicus sp.]|tara:strand:+ start:2756 stop:3055 length:300 start_codon:yes stop_codon:yes gene_type:complete
MNGPSLLKCICDETRFEILELLQKDNELCVNDFVEKLKKDQPLVSHHLKTLKKCGIVKSRDEGKKAMYTISNPQLSALISNVTKSSRKIPNLCTDEKCC